MKEEIKKVPSAISKFMSENGKKGYKSMAKKHKDKIVEWRSAGGRARHGLPPIDTSKPAKLKSTKGQRSK